VADVELYVKKALTVVEHPPIEVDRVFVVIASSEGASLEAVGRHMWANVKTLWNLARDGFRELIGQTKLDADFEKLWRATGGNPRAVEMLDEEGWQEAKLVEKIHRSRRLDTGILARHRTALEEALENPDALLKAHRELVDYLIHKNPVTRLVDPIAPLPPNKEIGVGRDYAWQTPLHREAVKLALESGRSPPQL
jgi:hypothetical protein